MKVAVVAPSHLEAVAFAATVGITSTAYGVTPGGDLTGQRYTACIVLPGVDDSGTVAWWADLRGRVDGPMFHVEREP